MSSSASDLSSSPSSSPSSSDPLIGSVGSCSPWGSMQDEKFHHPLWPMAPRSTFSDMLIELDGDVDLGDVNVAGVEDASPVNTQATIMREDGEKAYFEFPYDDHLVGLFPAKAAIVENINVSPQINNSGHLFTDDDFCGKRYTLKLSHEGESMELQGEVTNENSTLNHCSVCKLVFVTEDQLQQHQRHFQKALQCCQCRKSFARISRLVSHQRKHSKEKPFQCRSCGKFYTHRTTLARHQLHYCHILRAKCEDAKVTNICLEQGALGLEEPFPATTLGDDCVFSVPDLHDERSKSQISSDKLEPVACLVCDRQFADSAGLRYHRELHYTNRTCCLCLKVLGNRSKLVTHHRSHTKESPYTCTFCGKCFSESSTLRKHEATHGARNYTCPMCDRGFVRKDYLAKHLITHQQTFKCSECDFTCHDNNQIQKHVSVHASRKLLQQP